MVRLDRISTKAGDGGKTSLADGTRREKYEARIASIGDVDELNAVIGATIACGEMGREKVALLRRIQNDLFDWGADLASPEKENEAEKKPLRLTEPQLKFLEEAALSFNEKLKPLTSFILPGGGASAAWLHLARTVARRTERSCWLLQAEEPINPVGLKYLNRLSDLLFILARAENKQGEEDILWHPGAGRG